MGRFMLPEEKEISPVCQGCETYIDMVCFGTEPDHVCSYHMSHNTESSCPNRPRTTPPIDEEELAEIRKKRRRK